VVGYDNIAIAEWYDPALTTVDQPHYRMGQRAMQAVLDRLNHPEEPAEMIKFETTLLGKGYDRATGGEWREVAVHLRSPIGLASEAALRD
jgi:LacI family transcriptional regulator